MGCAASSVNPIKIEATSTNGTTASKLPTIWNISHEDKQIIKCSWHILKKDLTNNGLGIFTRIFKMSPKTKLLFGLSEDEIEENIRNMQSIRGHAARFMQAIGAAVEHLDDLDDTLTELLVDLGKQHKNIEGFASDYFDIFYDAMMGQWIAVLSDNFSSTVLDAWGHLFVFIMEKLKEGYLKVI